MNRGSVEQVIRALNDNGVRYLVVGGLAVVAHGFVRFTADVDLVLDLEAKNLERAINAFSSLGYRPRAPVALEEFIDGSNRARWMKEKGLTVFSLWSPDHPMTEIDLFVDQPFTDFGVAHSASCRQEVAPGVLATFVGYDDLLRLKRAAGRPEDLEDIAKLQRLRGDREDD